MQWFVGCSGFHYRGWKDIFYPEKLPQRLWFEYYNQRFNTLELNTTFYNFPKIHFLQNWYDKSPKDFVFTVKATKIITHYKKFVDVKSLMEDFYSVITKGLKEKLGPVLFQLPPNIQYSEQKLEQIIKCMYKGYSNVLEFRHASWWTKEVYTALTKENIAFSTISHPNLPDDVVINSDLFYCRMHGVPRLYTSRYKKQTLQNLFDTVNAKKKVKKAYVYFNNDSLVAAPKNALELKEISNRT